MYNDHTFPSGDPAFYKRKENIVKHFWYNIKESLCFDFPGTKIDKISGPKSTNCPLLFTYVVPIARKLFLLMRLPIPIK